MIFRLGIIKLRTEILAYEQQFKTWHKLLFTLTRDTLPKATSTVWDSENMAISLNQFFVLFSITE